MVYGEIELLAPQTTRPLDLVLPPGDYSFRCEAHDGATTLSEVQTVRGPAVPGAHPYRPVQFTDIQQATQTYRELLAPELAQLAADTHALRLAVDGGDLDRARQLWLPAHLDYERLGAAYDTFGDLGDRVDGRPDGLPGGVADPDFEGFLRLEHGLWHGEAVAGLTPVADALDDAVGQLVAQFPQTLTPANDLSLRTHEILEDTLQFELTAATDQGSHTNLATAAANVAGTQLALQALAPLLQARDPQLLSTVQDRLDRLATQLEAYDHGGTWVAVQDLPASDRERLDAALGALLETVAPIADILELPVHPDTSGS
jgi:high-affinity iron transporter